MEKRLQSGDDFQPWDYIMILIALISIMVPSGMVVWGGGILTRRCFSAMYVKKTRSADEILEEISDLDKGRRQYILRVLLSTNKTEDKDTTHLSDTSANLKKSNLEKSNSMRAHSKVYVTKTGNHFHLDPLCQHLRQSSIEKLPCQCCLR